MLLLPPITPITPITLVDSEAPVTPLKGKGGLCYQASQESDEREVEQRGGQERGGRSRFGLDFSPGKPHHRDSSPPWGPATGYPRSGFAPSPGQERGRQGRLATYPTYTKLKVLHQDGLAGTPAARPAMQKTEHVVCKTAAPPPTRVATRGYPDLEDGHREKSRKREELVPRK
jgi:hypothetical protein